MGNGEQKQAIINESIALNTPSSVFEANERAKILLEDAHSLDEEGIKELESLVDYFSQKEKDDELGRYAKYSYERAVKLLAELRKNKKIEESFSLDDIKNLEPEKLEEASSVYLAESNLSLDERLTKLEAIANRAGTLMNEVPSGGLKLATLKLEIKKEMKRISNQSANNISNDANGSKDLGIWSRLDEQVEELNTNTKKAQPPQPKESASPAKELTPTEKLDAELKEHFGLESFDTALQLIDGFHKIGFADPKLAQSKPKNSREGVAQVTTITKVASALPEFSLSSGYDQLLTTIGFTDDESKIIDSKIQSFIKALKKESLGGEFVKQIKANKSLFIAQTQLLKETGKAIDLNLGLDEEPTTPPPPAPEPAKPTTDATGLSGDEIDTIFGGSGSLTDALTSLAAVAPAPNSSAADTVPEAASAPVDINDPVEFAKLVKKEAGETLVALGYSSVEDIPKRSSRLAYSHFLHDEPKVLLDSWNDNYNRKHAAAKALEIYRKENPIRRDLDILKEIKQKADEVQALRSRPEADFDFETPDDDFNMNDFELPADVVDHAEDARKLFTQVDKKLEKHFGQGRGFAAVEEAVENLIAATTYHVSDRNDVILSVAFSYAAIDIDGTTHKHNQTIELGDKTLDRLNAKNINKLGNREIKNIAIELHNDLDNDEKQLFMSWVEDKFVKLMVAGLLKRVDSAAPPAPARRKPREHPRSSSAPASPVAGRRRAKISSVEQTSAPARTVETPASVEPPVVEPQVIGDIEENPEDKKPGKLRRLADKAWKMRGLVPGVKTERGENKEQEKNYRLRKSVDKKLKKHLSFDFKDILKEVESIKLSQESGNHEADKEFDNALLAFVVLVTNRNDDLDMGWSSKSIIDEYRKTFGDNQAEVVALTQNLDNSLTQAELNELLQMVEENGRLLVEEAQIFEDKSALVTAREPIIRRESATDRGEEFNLAVERFGLPIDKYDSVYNYGDNLYDHDFSIETASKEQGGEFLGEYGSVIAETVGVGDPKKVTATELWLFDKNEIRTKTKFLVSEHAFNSQSIREGLERNGDELVLAEPGKDIWIETRNLRMLVQIIDLHYGTSGDAPPNSYFDRLQVKMSVWKKDDAAAPPKRPELTRSQIDAVPGSSQVDAADEDAGILKDQEKQRIEKSVKQTGGEILKIVNYIKDKDDPKLSNQDFGYNLMTINVQHTVDSWSEYREEVRKSVISKTFDIMNAEPDTNSMHRMLAFNNRVVELNDALVAAGKSWIDDISLPASTRADDAAPPPPRLDLTQSQVDAVPSSSPAESDES